MRSKTSFYSSAKRRSLRAYTLIEIMLVLSIIAVLMGAAIYNLIGTVQGAKTGRVDGDFASISSQLRMYEINNRFLPTNQQGLMALVKIPDAEPRPRHWIQLFKEVPLDPWGHPYVYVYPGKHNTSSFDLYSLGPDGVESDDDLGNW